MEAVSAPTSHACVTPRYGKPVCPKCLSDMDDGSAWHVIRSGAVWKSACETPLTSNCGDATMLSNICSFKYSTDLLWLSTRERSPLVIGEFPPWQYNSFTRF